jgi:hypothetical protein
LGFTATVLGLEDTLAVSTGELGGWVAATFLDVVESKASEATVLVTLIRSI